MKKILILLIVIVAKVNSQVGYAVAPLEIGNLWVYEEYDDIFHTNLVRTTIYKLTDTVRCYVKKSHKLISSENNLINKGDLK